MHAFEKRKRQLQSKISSLKTALPEEAVKIINLINFINNNEEKDVNTLAKEVEKHPELVFEILKVANSPYFGIARKVNTVKDAILLLGIRMLKCVLCSALVFHLSKDKHASRDKHAVHLKKHLLWTAICSSEISSILKYEKNEIAKIYTCAVLHDVGKIVMANLFPPKKYHTFVKLVQNVTPGTAKYLNVERTMFGSCHCEIGACTADLWHFPETIVATIAAHHLIPREKEKIFQIFSPSIRDKAKKYATIICFADKLYYVKDKIKADDVTEEFLNQYFEHVKEFYETNKKKFLTKDFVEKIDENYSAMV